MAGCLSIEPYLIYEYPTVRKLTNHLKSNKRKNEIIEDNSNKATYTLENDYVSIWTIEENLISTKTKRIKSNGKKTMNLTIENKSIKERNIDFAISNLKTEVIEDCNKIRNLIEKWNSGEFESYTIYIRNESYTQKNTKAIKKQKIDKKIKNENNWCRKLDSCLDTSPLILTFRNSGPRIEWQNTIIYTVSHQGEMCCLEACHGHLIWRRHLNSK